jgi:hypothetical protein
VPTHAEARRLAKAALERRFGGAATVGEIKALAGIGWLETQYGTGWENTGNGEGTDSHNIGAIHGDASWPGDVFLSTDTKPNDDGTSTSYVTRFRSYPTAALGWLDLVDVAFVQNDRSSVRGAARASDWAGVSAALYETGYYQGFGATKAERIAHHRKALESAIELADDAAGRNMTASITIRVQNPQEDYIGTASVSEAVAPGLTPLAQIYGAPIMIAYPNGWRVLKFAPDVLIPVKAGLPFTSVDQRKPVSFGWQSGAAIGILGIAVTIFVETLRIQPGRTAHG